MISSIQPHSSSTMTTSSSRIASLKATWMPAIRLARVDCAATAATMLSSPAEASTLAPIAWTPGKLYRAAPRATSTTTATVSRRMIRPWVFTRRATRLSATSVR